MCVGHNDSVGPIVPVHDAVQVLRLLALSDSESAESCVVKCKSFIDSRISDLKNVKDF